MTASGDFEGLLSATGEVGFVSRISNWVVQVDGLPGASLGEMVRFEQGQLGMVTALNESELEVLVLARELVVVGMRVARSGSVFGVQVGEDVVGKTLDALGENWASRVKTNGTVGNLRPVDVVPTGIVGRKKIERQLVTGIMMIDLMIPVGKGQRELIMGDRKTGKSFVVKQIMLSSAKSGSMCVFAAIGKKRTEVIQMNDFFTKSGIADRAVIVATTSDDSAGEIYLCPYTAMTIAEYFRDQGRDVLLVLDDMTTHAKFYRELSLVSKKFPGRDSYPGDIFHIHSKLLERGGNFEVKGMQLAGGDISLDSNGKIYGARSIDNYRFNLRGNLKVSQEVADKLQILSLVEKQKTADGAYPFTITGRVTKPSIRIGEFKLPI